MLSRQYWPIHLKPSDDELLSSWLIRLCEAHGLRPHTFCDVVWPKKQIWNRDIDKCADFSIVDTLAKKTATPFLRAVDTHLKSYENRVFKRLNSNGNTVWIMPLSHYHRIRRNGGQAFCWQCLRQAGYYRKSWRLASTTVCVQHKQYLDTQCRDCGASINFHRVYMIKKPIWCCYQCGADFCESINERQHLAGDRDIRRQLHFDVLIQDGFWYLYDGTKASSPDVFSVVHQLCKLMLYNKSGPSLWRETGGIDRVVESKIFSERISLECLGNDLRNTILTRVYELLIDWPNRLIAVAKECRLSGSLWLRDMFSIPNWYIEPLLDHGIYIPFSSTMDKYVNR